MNDFCIKFLGQSFGNVPGKVFPIGIPGSGIRTDNIFPIKPQFLAGITNLVLLLLGGSHESLPGRFLVPGFFRGRFRLGFGIRGLPIYLALVRFRGWRSL